MTIRIRDGFEALVLGVMAFLTANGVTAQVVTGYRELAKQANQGPGGANRIVIVPGDENGGAGKIVPVRDPGMREIPSTADPTVIVGEVRSLGDWDRPLTLSVWACDSSALRDELAQGVAATALMEWAIRAVLMTGFANVALAGVRWIVPKENTFGAELRVGLVFSSPIYDVPLEAAVLGFTLVKE